MTNYSLTRRYWISLLCLTFSAGSRASMSVRYGYSLWSRYWAALLGSPPCPGAANSTRANGTTASLVIPDVPRKRMKAKKGLVAVAAVVLCPIAVATAIFMASPGSQPGHLAANPLPPSAAVPMPALPPVNTSAPPKLGIIFGPGRSQLSDSAKADLGRWLTEFDSTTPGVILIVGYGDSGRTAARNSKLSLQRARAVATFIKAQGIPASRLTVRGAGDPGRTQAFNRLVFISVTEPTSSAP